MQFSLNLSKRINRERICFNDKLRQGRKIIRRETNLLFTQPKPCNHSRVPVSSPEPSNSKQSVKINSSKSRDTKKRPSRAYARIRAATPRTTGSISVVGCCKDRIDASLHRVTRPHCAPLHAP